MNEEDYKIYSVPVTALQPYENNPRVGNVHMIAESLKTNGQYKPIVVRRETHEILAGNHTFLAAKNLGWETIKVAYVDNITEEQAKKIVIADNRTSDLSQYNNFELLKLLETLPTLDGTGYLESDVQSLKHLTEIVLGETDKMAEWEGMPEFEQNERKAAYQTRISFPTQEDADKFFEEIGYTKKQEWWWPNNDGLAQTMNSYIYVEELSEEQ